MSDKTANTITKSSGCQFNGVVWRTVVHDEKPWVGLEIRNESTRQVSFSILDLDTGLLVWENVQFEESWWLSLAAIGDVVMLTHYDNPDNPDLQSVLAVDLHSREILWWKNKFSFHAMVGKSIIGTDSSLGTKFVALNLQDGMPLNDKPDLTTHQNFLLRKPLQYLPQTTYYETVADFLRKQVVAPEGTIEYLEVDEFVFISFYSRNDANLANYLIVVTIEGKFLLNEKIGEHLKGIGLDTFFIFCGYLIFVKNKSELVSYKLI